MRRREFIGGVGAYSVVGVRGAWAQQAGMPVVGFFGGTSEVGWSLFLAAFRRGLNEQGYVEGTNVTIIYRWADNQLDRLPEIAADLVGRRVAAIVTGGGAAPALVAKAATSTIPIVFAQGSDPVQSGLVASLNRPAATRPV